MKKENIKVNNIWKKEIKRRTPIYITGVLFHMITTIINLTIPLIIGNILDMIMAGNIVREEILKECIKLIVLIIIHVIPRSIYRTCYYTNARASDITLRKKVYKHLQIVLPEYFDKEDKGTYLAYLSQELLLTLKSFGNMYGYIACTFIVPIISTIYVFKNFHPILSVIIIPVLITVAIYIMKQYKYLDKTLENSREKFVELSQNIQRNTDGFNLIKMYNEQNEEKEKFEKVNSKTYEANVEIGVVKNKISNAMNIAYAITYIFTFGIGLFLVKNNQVTIGLLTGVIGSLEFALSDVMNSIVPLLNSIGLYKQTKRRYNYFYNLETYKDEGKTLEKVDCLEIKNLTYSFDEQKNVLENINMSMKVGENIGIIGQVGSGKTTLMNIICGFYKIPNGVIFINGIDINEYKRTEIFKNIGYAMQKNVLINGNILENINMNEEENENRVLKALELAEIKEEVENMEHSLNTNLGETASRLSGGQKQRISIARNLNYTKQISIYDDTLSALDTETETRVFKNIINKEKDNILIVVSNKVSHMKKMNKIYVLLDGKIQDVGTHEELLQKNDLYRELQTYELAGDVI